MSLTHIRVFQIKDEQSINHYYSSPLRFPFNLFIPDFTAPEFLRLHWDTITYKFLLWKHLCRMLSLEPVSLFHSISLYSLLWYLFFADLWIMGNRSNGKRKHSLMMMVFTWSLREIRWRTCLLVDLCFARRFHAFLSVELSTVVQSWMLQVFLLFLPYIDKLCFLPIVSLFVHMYACT